jgi:hypothetical protein
MGETEFRNRGLDSDKTSQNKSNKKMLNIIENKIQEFSKHIRSLPLKEIIKTLISRLKRFL